MCSTYKLSKQGDNKQPWLPSQFETSPLFHIQLYCCFLTSMQVSQETNQMVYFSHLFKNFTVVIHTIKGFSLVSEAEVKKM